MSGKVRVRFWVEASLALLSAGLGVVTLLWHNWIELLFGVEPDGGDGSFEWGIVVFLLSVAAAFSLLARAEWRRGRAGAQSA
jgi:hypothetical protein